MFQSCSSEPHFLPDDWENKNGCIGWIAGALASRGDANDGFQLRISETGAAAHNLGPSINLIDCLLTAGRIKCSDDYQSLYLSICVSMTRIPPFPFSFTNSTCGRRTAGPLGSNGDNNANNAVTGPETMTVQAQTTRLLLFQELLERRRNRRLAVEILDQRNHQPTAWQARGWPGWQRVAAVRRQPLFSTRKKTPYTLDLLCVRFYSAGQRRAGARGGGPG